jgi:hypothetical protein
VGGRTGEVRITVEATPGSQTDEYLARASLQSPLELNGIVAGVKDEQGYTAYHRGSSEQPLYLLGGDRVRFLVRADPPRVHRGGPALSDEVELGDELVGPSGDDGLTGGVSGRMVVEAALGTTLGVASGPHAHVHGVDGRFVRAVDGERMADKQVAQGVGVDPPPVQRGVEAAPAATMRRLEAQVSGRRDGGLRGEDGVGELEESVGSAVEASVERAAEGVESGGRFHDAPIMRSPMASRTPYLPAGLKRKVSTPNKTV